MRPWSVLAILCGAAGASTAHADWLVALPPDVLPPEVGSRHASSPTELVYPRAGLPALVEPGETLIARVLVPAPLMPAPGIQQPRALRGWSAELIGHGQVVDEGAEHRYGMRVVDVRADGASGLVFRATVRIPPWAAPGTYTFRIDSPGSVVAAAAGAVRVLVPGRAPIAARYAEHTGHEALDVDVWLSEHTLPARLVGAGIPWLDTRIDARFALQPRVGGEPSRIQSYVFLEEPEPIVLEGATWYPATNVRSPGVRPSLVARVVARVGEAPTPRREGRCAPLDIEAPEETIVDAPIVLRAGDAQRVAWAFEEDGARYEAEPQIRLRWIGVQEVHALAVEDGCARRGQVAIRVQPALRMGCSAGADPSGFLWFLGLLCTIFPRRYKPRRNLSPHARRPPHGHDCSPLATPRRCLPSHRLRQHDPEHDGGRHRRKP